MFFQLSFVYQPMHTVSSHFRSIQVVVNACLLSLLPCFLPTLSSPVSPRSTSLNLLSSLLFLLSYLSSLPSSWPPTLSLSFPFSSNYCNDMYLHWYTSPDSMMSEIRNRSCSHCPLYISALSLLRLMWACINLH